MVDFGMGASIWGASGEGINVHTLETMLSTNSMLKALGRRQGDRWKDPHPFIVNSPSLLFAEHKIEITSPPLTSRIKASRRIVRFDGFANDLDLSRSDNIASRTKIYIK